MKALLALLSMATLALGQEVDTVRFVARMETVTVGSETVRRPTVARFANTLTYTNAETGQIGGGWVIVGNVGSAADATVLVEVHGLSDAIKAVKQVQPEGGGGFAWIRLPKDSESVPVGVRTSIAVRMNLIVPGDVLAPDLAKRVRGKLGISDWESAICSVGKAKESE